MALFVAAFGDERRAVCRPLLAWLLLNEKEAGRRGGGRGRRAYRVGWGATAFLQTLGWSVPGPRFYSPGRWRVLERD